MTNNPFENAGPGRQNPFEAPRVQDAGRVVTPGMLDIGVALSDGWQATWRNIGPWIGLLLVGGLVGIVSGITVIGIFAVWPILMLGAVRFALNANDGQAALGDLFAGFSDYVRTLGLGLGAFGLSFVISLPGSIVTQVAPFVGGDSAFVLIAIGYIIQLAWSFAVVARFYPATFYIVDQGYGVVEAYKAAWEATSQQKLNVGLMVVISGLVALAGIFALVVGIIPASLLATVAWASAYRQLSGTRRA